MGRFKRERKKASKGERKRERERERDRNGERERKNFGLKPILLSFPVKFCQRLFI